MDGQSIATGGFPLKRMMKADAMLANQLQVQEQAPQMVLDNANVSAISN